MNPSIRIAVAKGRILRDALPLLAAAGCEARVDPETSRKLIIPTADAAVQLVIVRPGDVPAYVRFGAADLGVTGKDVLLEQRGLGFYELLDLGFARCRLVEARRADPAPDTERRRLRVATKYARVARDWFAARGVQTEIVALSGSVELAPLTGLAERIIDLVDSGRTLRENGLVEIETVAEISARLVANQAATRLKAGVLRAVVERIRDASRQSRDG